MSEPSYIIGSGWWCDGSAMDRIYHGDDRSRTEGFHKLWYTAIDTFTKPEKILIVDSASPTPVPVNKDDNRIELVRLPSNPGHASDPVDKYAGWTVSALLGMQYAYCSGADYFVYVEQDVLLYGEGIIELCISRMKKPFMFGTGRGACHPLQQSFFIVHRSKIEALHQRVSRIPARDCFISPEKKFCIATSPFLRACPANLFAQQPNNLKKNWFARQKARYSRKLMDLLSWYDDLPVGPGGYQNREPVDFTGDYFYFQHATNREIEKYIEKYRQQYGTTIA